MPAKRTQSVKSEKKARYEELKSMVYTSDNNITIVPKPSEAKLMLRLSEKLGEVYGDDDLSKAFDIFTHIFPRFFLADKKAKLKEAKDHYKYLMETAGAPPKPKSAYGYLCADDHIRNKVKKQLSDAGIKVTATEITKALSEMWRSSKYREYREDGELTDAATKKKYTYTEKALKYAKMREEAKTLYHAFCDQHGIEIKGKTTSNRRGKNGPKAKAPLTIFIENNQEMYEEFITEYVSEHGGRKDSDIAKKYAKSKMQTEYTLLSASESKVYKDMAKEYKLKLTKKEEEDVEEDVEEEDPLNEPNVKTSPIVKDRSSKDRSSRDKSPRDSLLSRIQNVQRDIQNSQNSQQRDQSIEIEIERRSNRVPNSTEIERSIEEELEELDEGNLNGFEDEDEEFDIFDYDDDDESDLILSKFGYI